MKQFFRLSCASFALILFLGTGLLAQAQTADPFVTQISSSTFESFAGGISGNGRFVVIESNGDIATVPPGQTAATKTPNNADGNREIFLFDYAQRRIFQITNTKSALRDAAQPSTTNSNIAIEVSNNQPAISNNGRWLTFSSNASNPANFDGNDAANRAALAADGNQELFLYFVPAPPAATLTSGANVPFFDLANGELTRLTNTPASRLPTGGTTSVSPFVANDNRESSMNDNASVIAFVSTRDLTGTNADGNPEIFLFRRITASPATGTFHQVTNTTGSTIFNANPNVSGIAGGTTTLAFISNANIAAGGSSNNADLNGEVYLGTFDGTTVTITRQVTRTTNSTTNGSAGVNLFSPGQQRISRDGNFLAFESYADLSGDNSVKTTTTVFMYNVAANTFTQVGPRGNNTSALRFPTFTDYNAAGQPSTILFSSFLNFTATGAAPATATDGLNPNGRTQIFAAPVAAPTTFTRITDTPAFASPDALPPAIQTFASNARLRIAFSLSRTELGGGNSDSSTESYYLLSPTTTDTAGTISFFTGASNRPVTGPSPTPPAVAGLSPGMLAIARSATALAPSEQDACTGGGTDCQDETKRVPPLPTELNGVSLSINGAAAALRHVSATQITFVVPVGLAANTGTNTYPVVINNNGSVIRTTIQILPAQPDIFTTSNDAGGRAAVVTGGSSGAGMFEPFNVPTVLSIMLTGVRGVTKGQVTVRIGTTDLTGAAILTDAVPVTNMFGFYQIDVQAPASLAGAGDVPVIVTVVSGGVTTTSRPADTAPRIRIN
ncbi:MAG TPA: hypothetical protein VF553_11190 [Pyrinomonadaceae bacterium]